MDALLSTSETRYVPVPHAFTINKSGIKQHSINRGGGGALRKGCGKGIKEHLFFF